MVGAVGTAHSCSNPNTTVWNSKGIWLTYILMILFLHFTLLSIPGNDFKRPKSNASQKDIKLSVFDNWNSILIDESQTAILYLVETR